MGSGPDEASDGGGCFLDLEFGFGASGGERLTDAVLEVVFEQLKGDGLEGLGGGGDLGEDVDAVLVLVDHSLQAADLSLDPAQPAQHLVLVGRVAGHLMTSVPLCLQQLSYPLPVFLMNLGSGLTAAPASAAWAGPRDPLPAVSGRAA